MCTKTRSCNIFLELLSDLKVCSFRSSKYLKSGNICQDVAKSEDIALNVAFYKKINFEKKKRECEILV